MITLTVLLFACLDTTTKYLTRYMPVAEVVWGRYLAQLVLMIAVLGPTMGRRLLRTRRPGMQIVRSVLMLGSTVFAIWGFSLLPLADAVTIGFTTPMLVTALSVPLLGEKVGPRRWAAVAVGFAGVVIVMRPGSGVLGVGAVIMLVMALVYALYQIVTRVLGQTEDPYASQFYAAIIGTLLSTLALPFIWHPLDLRLTLLLLLAGLFGGTGHFLMIKAYGLAPASVLVPFTYTALIWVTILGWVVFDEVPDRWTFVGMAIIAGSGLYIANRERIKRRTWEPSKPVE
jgi:drug/metabolite transporter (DMT)-like permease